MVVIFWFGGSPWALAAQLSWGLLATGTKTWPGITALNCHARRSKSAPLHFSCGILHGLRLTRIRVPVPFLCLPSGLRPRGHSCSETGGSPGPDQTTAPAPVGWLRLAGWAPCQDTMA